jgi:hypothetical protein
MLDGVELKMNYTNANREISHVEAEVCLNLWYFVEATGLVFRLAAKAYALRGTEEEKLAALRQLSGTDHLTATQGFVPKRFVSTLGKETIAGAIPAPVIHDNHSTIFGPLMDQVEAELPKQIHVVEGEYREFTMKLPRAPLCVTTSVYETESGQLVARISDRP